ncbi:MAG: D-glycero-beta-D-manno-heptose-7-phosphate kinase [Sphingobacteriales bacterium]|nr:D-glycero-beta-D-manno-heptose-7-phosphate kinase [Sphingobacteriales bacterium]
MSSWISQIMNSFAGSEVMIVGDVMIDHYIFGKISRISPEAPVPILDVSRQEFRLGGAANVALNIKELGATPILVSVIGDHRSGYDFLSLLRDQHINTDSIILDQSRITTVKTRLINQNNMQILRYDEEVRDPLEKSVEILLVNQIADLIEEFKPKVLVLQDYNKGVLTPFVIEEIIKICRQYEIPTAVDPKKHNFFTYKGCTLFKPNLKEATEGLSMPAQTYEDLVAAAARIEALLDNETTVITLSERGIFYHNSEDSNISRAYNKSIYDVSGAGDTVVSILAMGLALGLDLSISVELANIAAAVVCSKIGVSPITSEELIAETEAIFGIEVGSKETENSEVYPPQSEADTIHHFPEESID